MTVTEPQLWAAVGGAWIGRQVSVAGLYAAADGGVGPSGEATVLGAPQHTSSSVPVQTLRKPVWFTRGDGASAVHRAAATGGWPGGPITLVPVSAGGGPASWSVGGPEHAAAIT